MNERSCLALFNTHLFEFKGCPGKSVPGRGVFRAERAETITSHLEEELASS